VRGARRQGVCTAGPPPSGHGAQAISAQGLKRAVPERRKPKLVPVDCSAWLTLSPVSAGWPFHDGGHRFWEAPERQHVRASSSLSVEALSDREGHTPAAESQPYRLVPNLSLGPGSLKAFSEAEPRDAKKEICCQVPREVPPELLLPLTAKSNSYLKLSSTTRLHSSQRSPSNRQLSKNNLPAQ
jgi:hypothetical protein